MELATERKNEQTFQLAGRVNRIDVSPTMVVLQEAEKLKAQGIDVADFGPGEPDFPTPEHIKRAVVKALEENRTKYTPVAGIAPLRQSICDWHKAQLESSYQPSECVVTVGGKHAIFNAICSLINSGDEVIIGTPYWVSYPDMVKYAGGNPVFVETLPNDSFILRASEVERAITPRTKIVIANSPNNPTGSVITPSEFARLQDFCNRRNIWLLSDECYSHFVFKDAKPFSAASIPRTEKPPDYRRIVFENVRNDRIAPWLHPCAQTVSGRYRQVAKPIHFQSNVHHSICWPRSDARADGLGH